MATAAQITLSAIGLVAINRGGYRFTVRCTPAAQAAELVLVQVGPDGPCVSLGAAGVFTPDRLPALLQAIAVQGLWARSIACKALRVDPNQTGTELYLMGDDGRMSPRQVGVIAESAPSYLTSPVEPYQGRLYPGSLALIRLGTAIPRIPYVWTGTQSDPKGDGRVLSDCIGNRHYFTMHGDGSSAFETNPLKRGLDCTTFVVTAFDVHEAYCSGPDAFGDGGKVADCLNAQPCGLEEADGLQGVPAASLSAFFDANAGGEFIMWKPGKHCVMAIRGEVLEYTIAPVWGFRRTPVQAYLAAQGQHRFKVRALPGTVPVTTAVGAGPRVAPGVGGSLGGAPAGGPPAAGPSRPSVYTVVSGDSLSLITGRLWGDVLLWPILYDANRQVVGPDPNRIVPGQRLTVPDIKGYSAQQLNAARQRGRVS